MAKSKIETKEQRERLKKKSISVAKKGIDRGLFFTWKEFQQQLSFFKKLSFLLIIGNILLGILALYKIDSTSFFILNSKEDPIRLTKIEKLPITENRVISFVDEAVTNVFSLNYRYAEDQIRMTKKYFDSYTYTKFVQELQNSNYLAILQRNKAIITVIPTPTVFKISVIGPDLIEVIRSYAREDISKNYINTEETAYRTVIRRVIPSDRNPWGFVITSLKEVDINRYKPHAAQ